MALDPVAQPGRELLCELLGGYSVRDLAGIRHTSPTPFSYLSATDQTAAQSWLDQAKAAVASNTFNIGRYAGVVIYTPTACVSGPCTTGGLPQEFISIRTVPEPASLLLFALGAATLAGYRRRTLARQGRQLGALQADRFRGPPAANHHTRASNSRPGGHRPLPRKQHQTIQVEPGSKRTFRPEEHEAAEHRGSIPAARRTTRVPHAALAANDLVEHAQERWDVTDRLGGVRPMVSRVRREHQDHRRRIAQSQHHVLILHDGKIGRPAVRRIERASVDHQATGADADGTVLLQIVVIHDDADRARRILGRRKLTQNQRIELRRSAGAFKATTRSYTSSAHGKNASSPSRKTR